MKLRLPLAVAICALSASIYTLSACNNGGPKDLRASAPAADTPVREVYAGPAKDTARNTRHAQNKDSGEENPGGDLTDIFNEYVARYKTPCLIDSAFRVGADRFIVHLKHYCLMDSGITVPHKYVGMYKLDHFVTHNFATQVQVERNDSIILRKTVYKKDFDMFLYPELKDYGALRCPAMAIKNDNIELHYSISIPLTDVGIGATAAIDRDGNVTYKDR